MDPETQGVEEQQQPVQAAAAPEAQTTSAGETPSPQAQSVQSDEQEDGLPTEPDKQREAFIRMRQENKALKEQLGQGTRPAVQDEEAVLDQFRHRQVPQAQIPAQVSPEEALYHMQQLAHQGQATAQQVVELQQQLEDQRLFSEFPELNPRSEEFKKPENRAFEKHLAGKYVLEQLRGNQPDIVSLARQAKAEFDLLSKPQQEALAQETAQAATREEQATLEARGAHENVPPSNQNEDAFRGGARRGDPGAIAELLKGRG